ncbi:hypothetical protein E4U43_000444 [Claviceps pusilla]|uniref:3'-5' exonuclease domain-containing protein n=1 Tax=Claviceps pusilla TaxID=123648 RepID=A0A9P7SZ32_9HYPO|nr:hypothetical protein E4U43_000444 [Claviceps pusilla]
MTYLNRAGPRGSTARRLISGRSRSNNHGRLSADDRLYSRFVSPRWLSIRAMAMPLRNGTKTRLWSPEMGICFSPTPSTSPHSSPEPPYPRLDMARFFQTASHGAEAGFGPSKEASGAGGDVASSEKDRANVESIELCIRSTGLPRFPSSSSSSAADIASQHASIPAQSPPTLEQSLRDLHIKDQETQPMRNVDVKPPSTSLSFNISSDAFYAARAAKAGSSGSFWSHTMYERTSAAGVTEKVEVHYCTNNQAMESICKQYFLDQDVLGFDLEWFPFATRDDSARDNVSLIQLASPDCIALFHVAIFPSTDDLVSPTFRKIMQDATVSKVGVQIRGDCNRLSKYLDVTARGIFELSHLYKQIKFTEAKTPKRINKVPVALATQVEELLRLPLFKGDVVRSSNWTKRLTQQQILYAASDAYAGIQLYHVLETKRKMLNPCPDRPHHLELGLPIPFLEPKSPQSQSEADNAETQPAAVCHPTVSARPQSKPRRPASPTTPPHPLPPQQQKQQQQQQQQQLAPHIQVSRHSSQDSRLIAADEQVAQHQASRKPVFARPAHLRAYFLWYSNHDLSLEDIAAMLRNPPLQPNTVLLYILDAIVAEKLPHDRQRLKLELLLRLHEKLRLGRYGTLARSCEEDVGECEG